MKIVVIGGSGLIGSKLVNKLREHGHEAVPASPNTGVNTLTGEGLTEVLKGASVVVDVSNSPSFEETVAMNFFTTATPNLLRYGQAAGVRHHVALSVVGTDRLAENRPSDAENTIRGYFRAKLAQEKLIAESSIPFSIVHATQFFEFFKNIADTSSDSTTVRLAPVLIQPMAAEDVARAVGRIAVGTPVNGIVEIGALNSSISTNLSARACSRVTILARWLRTLPPATSGLKLTSTRWYQEMMPGLVKRASKPGSLRPRSRPRMHRRML